MKSGVLVAALALAAAAVGTAVAAFPADNVKLYTGCLNSGGTINYVKEGDSPLQTCSSPKQVVKLSGGDITSVNTPAGSGLSGGSTNGVVTLSLDAAHSLPTGCSNGQVAKSTGSNAWDCGDDNDTTYSADETTLDLSGSTFRIDPDYRVKNTPDCSSGQFATGFDSDGDIQCSAPASTGLEVWQKVNPALDAVGVIVLPEGEGVDLIQMPLPAGTFLMTAVANVEGRGTDSIFADCKLRDSAFTILPVAPANLNITDGAKGNVGGQVTIHGVLTLASPNTVRFTCFSGDGDGSVAYSTMTAVRVGTVHT